MRICIIGCGYVGKAAASQWRASGHEITVTARTLEKAYTLRPYADLVHVLNDDWIELIDKQDVVLVCVAPDKKSDYLQTYLKTAEAVVSAVKHQPVKQIIYTSSTSVYGDHRGNWVNENTLLQPMNANTQILLSTENTFLKAANDQTNVCIFRLGEIYGEGRSIEERLQRMQGMKFPGTGENYTNLIHLNEILSAFDLALSKNLNGIFNLCNDIHITRKEFYQSICQEQGWPEVEWDPALSNHHGGNKKVSNEKLKSLGWTGF